MTGHRDTGAKRYRDRTEPGRLDLSDPITLRQIWEVQRAAYALEADLIGFDGIPQLHESLHDLRDCDEAFLGLSDEVGLAGAVSWKRLPNGALNICRLVVHPRAHRRGIATALLDKLDALEPADLTVVSTGTANLPGLALYQQRGFTPTGQREIAPGVTVTLLERRIQRPDNQAPDPPVREVDPQRHPNIGRYLHNEPGL